MKLEHAKKIVEVGQDCGLDVEIREGYSGRGMQGQQTTGIVGKHQDIVHALIETAWIEGMGDQDSSLLLTMREIRWDNMGQQMIAY